MKIVSFVRSIKSSYLKYLKNSKLYIIDSKSTIQRKLQFSVSLILNCPCSMRRYGLRLGLQENFYRQCEWHIKHILEDSVFSLNSEVMHWDYLAMNSSWTTYTLPLLLHPFCCVHGSNFINWWSLFFWTFSILIEL